jgi:hypothetical protein
MSQNPYAAPVASSQAPLATQTASGLYRRGSLLVVERGAPFPPTCIKTGVACTDFIARKHSWHHPAIAITILLSPIIYLFIALIVRKKSQFSVAVSPQAVAQRRIGILIGSVVLAIGIGLFAYGVVNSAPGPNNQWALLMPIGALVFVVGVLFAGKFGAYYGIKSIDDRFTTISGAHRDFLAQIPDYPTPAAPLR